MKVIMMVPVVKEVKLNFNLVSRRAFYTLLELYIYLSNIFI